MAQIFAPGVAQTAVRGKNGSNVWACILHWNNGNAVAWTQQLINQLSTEVELEWRTFINPICLSNVSLSEVQTVDLTDGGNRAALTLSPANAGGAVGPEFPANCTAMINFSINSRYRGGHPRVYLPAGSGSNTTDFDTWTPGAVGTFKSAFDNFHHAVENFVVGAGALACKLTCPRYTYELIDDPVHHRYIRKRNGYIGTFDVVDTAVSPQIRTQRRRLGP